MAMQLKGGGGAISEINVTPLVDVMLVLLIIFMVTATLVREETYLSEVEMQLPVTQGSPTVVNLEDTQNIILTIDARLVVRIAEEMITDCSAAMESTELRRYEPCFDEIQEKLGMNARLMETKQIYVLADADIPYGFVVGTLNRIRMSGVDNVGMVTNPEYLTNQEPE
jgi:biopolymer transport protein TolR